MFIYGKIFNSMFNGSLYGKGWGPLLVMSYVVAHGVPDREHGMVVELNPKQMADQFGEEEKDVRDAIRLLCEPDPESTTPDENGCRLVRLGAFLYRIVNGAKYQAIANDLQRREAAKLGMQKLRDREKAEGIKRPRKPRVKPEDKPSRGSTRAETMAGAGEDVVDPGVRHEETKVEDIAGDVETEEVEPGLGEECGDAGP